MSLAAKSYCAYPDEYVSGGELVVLPNAIGTLAPFQAFGKPLNAMLPQLYLSKGVYCQVERLLCMLKVPGSVFHIMARKGWKDLSLKPWKATVRLLS